MTTVDAGFALAFFPAITIGAFVLVSYVVVKLISR